MAIRAGHYRFRQPAAQRLLADRCRQVRFARPLATRPAGLHFRPCSRSHGRPDGCSPTGRVLPCPRHASTEPRTTRQQQQAGNGQNNGPPGGRIKLSTSRLTISAGSSKRRSAQRVTSRRICSSAAGSSIVVKSPASRPSQTATSERRRTLPERVLGSALTK